MADTFRLAGYVRTRVSGAWSYKQVSFTAITRVACP
jgi:hypothetical protein